MWYPLTGSSAEHPLRAVPPSFISDGPEGCGDEAVEVVSHGCHHSLAVKVNEQFPGLKLVPLSYQPVVDQGGGVSLVDGDGIGFDFLAAGDFSRLPANNALSSWLVSIIYLLISESANCN